MPVFFCVLFDQPSPSGYHLDATIMGIDTVKPEVTKALGYWQVAMQYLDLSENVSALISEHDNKWVFIQQGFDEEKLKNEHSEATKWTDYNQGIPVIFNFYHGIELILKGFLISAGCTASGHNLSTLLAQAKRCHPKGNFLNLIDKYVITDPLPEVIQTFLNETSSNIDEWYQAFKYPESNKGAIYAHNKLQFQEEKGSIFYKELSKDIHEIRIQAVKYARESYSGIA